MRLTEQQWKVLRFYLQPDAVDRVRAIWLDGTSRTLGQVAEPFAYHPAAFVLKVYRLADDDAETFRGDALGRTLLTVSDLRELEPCWAVPLRTLSALGEDLAAKAWEPPQGPVQINVKAPHELERWLAAKSKAEGRTRTALILQAITEYRERNP